MRLKSDPQRYFQWSTGSSAKIVREYEEKFKGISDVLDANPQVLELAAADLRKLSTGGRKGRKATYTAENLLRALIVHQIEGTALRETMVRIAHSLFLQDFLRLGPRPVMDFTLIDRAFNAIRPATWKKINDVLSAHAVAEGRLTRSTLRVDTTVVESNIHWPTDSSLLWDSWRVAYRILAKAREELPGAVEGRFHRRKVKKLHLYITRYMPSTSKKRQRSVRAKQKQYLAQVERILRAAHEFVEATKKCPDLRLWALGSELASYLPSMRKVLAVAERAWLHGEKVPAAERIFSIFEGHTELIKRGRRHKPVEFGHMVLLGQTKERFITQYDVMERKVPDCRLPQAILDRHEESFGAPPETLVADKGFRGDADAMEKIRERVNVVAIPERLKDYADESFVALQHFRAGIEGTISVLKRAFGLLRSRYRGFKNFVSNVALGVLCHNLVLLSRPPGG